jgi:Zn finger protein HypA/HybF involved in hydrogenase expression
MPFQSDWMRCHLCQCLCYTGLWNGSTTGPCRGNPGGNHDFTGSGTYVLIYDEEAAPGQPDWKACQKCRELTYTKNRMGDCPAGGAHDFTLSGNYKIGGGQSNWRWCDQCQALVFAGDRTPGACPGPGRSQVHVHAGSNYNVPTIAL